MSKELDNARIEELFQEFKKLSTREQSNLADALVSYTMFRSGNPKRKTAAHSYLKIIGKENKWVNDILCSRE